MCSRGPLRTTVAVAALLTASAALAQPHPARPDAEAEAHFLRGVARTDEGAYDAAMAEFSAAWERSHNPRILYNLAVTHEARGDAATAMTTLERFIREAPPAAVEARRADVDAARARLSPRVATVLLSIDLPDLELRVDGAVVPLDRARLGAFVNAGRRRITLTAPHRQTIERVVDLAAGAREVLSDEPPPIVTTVAVECPVADAEVFVDDVRVGRTPLDTPVTVPEGAHTLEVRRAGYTTFSRAIDARGVGVRVRAELAWSALSPGDGARIVVRATEPAVLASLDGRRIALDGSELLPPGPHRLSVITDRFLPSERDVDLTAGATLDARVVLVPTPSFRAEYDAHARQARRTAAAFLWPGVAVTALGAAATVWTALAWREAEDRYAAADARLSSCTSRGDCSASVTRSLPGERDQAGLDADVFRAGALIAGAVSVVGVGALVTGLVLRASAPRIDRFPAVALRPTAGGAALGLSGAF